MSALRQRAALVVRRARPSQARSSRSYASDAHGHHDHHHHAHNVQESFGPGFYVAIGAIPVSMLVYSISRPSADGEPTAISKLLTRWSDQNAEWERVNSLHTAAIEQAAHDKHLLYYSEGNKHVELKYPEVFQTGSPINVPAGHYVNLDKVVAHYRQQHVAEEERKAKKMAEARKE